MLLKASVFLASLSALSAQPEVVGPEIDARVIHLPELPEYPENELLSGAERLFLGEISGPESFAIDPTDATAMYSGLGDGSIIKLVDTEGTISYETFVERTGIDTGNCGSGLPVDEAQCGRPLGMHFDETGDNLLVVDAYQGILSYARNGTKTLITDRVTGEDEPFVMLNGMAVDEDTGDVYFTESSRRWTRSLALYEVLEGIPTGRLLKWTKATDVTECLVDEVLFPNGLTFSHDHKYIYVDLLTEAKIGRYRLGNGRWDPDWMTNVPGLPDNIKQRTSQRADGQLTYFVGLGSRRAAGYSFLDTIAPFPSVREAFARYVPAIDLVLTYGEVYGNVIEINDDGEIVQSLQDPAGVVAGITEAFECGDYLYFGTSLYPWLARIPRAGYV